MLGPLNRDTGQRAQRLPRARGPGFTLIELMITLAILAVLLAIAVPSMREFIARKRVEGIAQELVTDLRLLKSQQIQRRQFVGILFGSNASSTCYSLFAVGTSDDNCNCAAAGSPICPNPGGVGSSSEIKTVVVPRSTGVTLSATPQLLRLFGHNAAPISGVTLSTSVQSSLGGTLRVSTNLLAQPSLCSVSGAESSLPACPPSP